MRPKPDVDLIRGGVGQTFTSLADQRDQKLLDWYRELEQEPMVQRILDIPTKGPIFILDARDVYAPETIDFWLGLAQRTVSVEKFGRAAQDCQEMIKWQNQNPEKVKIPD